MRGSGPRIVVLAGLSDRMLDDSISPILAVEDAVVDVIRTNPGIEKRRVTYICPPLALRRSRFLSLLWKLLVSIRLSMQVKMSCVFAMLVFPHLYLAFLIATLARRPFIYMVVASDYEFKGKGRVLDWLTMKIVKRATKILVSDNVTADHLVENGIPESRIEWYQRLDLINLDRFFPMGLERFTDLIVVSRLVPGKNVDIFVEIVARLKEARPNIKAEIVGDGILRRDLERLVRDSGLLDNIRFLGYVPLPTTLNRILNSAKIFVLNSSHEGGPYTIYEAMAAGVCCVSSSVGEVSHVIDHGYNGFIVPKYDDVDAYVSILTELLNDTKRLQETQGRAAEIKGRAKTSGLVQFWKDITLNKRRA
jgi:glycosyltransferase involved in cell wall biosynthesis